MRLSVMATTRAPVAATTIDNVAWREGHWPPARNAPAKIRGREKTVCSSLMKELYFPRKDTRTPSVRRGGQFAVVVRISSLATADGIGRVRLTENNLTLKPGILTLRP